MVVIPWYKSDFYLGKGNVSLYTDQILSAVFHEVQLYKHSLEVVEEPLEATLRLCSCTRS